MAENKDTKTTATVDTTTNTAASTPAPGATMPATDVQRTGGPLRSDAEANVATSAEESRTTVASNLGTQPSGDAVNPAGGDQEALANSSRVSFTGKLNASGAAKDANRDQNFDGTNQDGKDTLGTSKAPVPRDPAAEASQLTVNQLTGDLSAGPAGIPRPVVGPGSAMVAEDAATAGPTKYYRSSIPTFNFRFANGQRAQFSNYWLVTNDANVQFYVERRLMTVPNTSIKIEEGTEADYNRDRNLYGVVQPVIEPLPVQEELDARTFRQTALQAKAPRTADNPDVIEPEVGNAQQDHFTNFRRTQTDDLNRPVVDDRIGPTEAQRSVQERNAIGGAAPSVDVRANAPNPMAARGGVTTGMQSSVGASSAPRAPARFVGTTSSSTTKKQLRSICNELWRSG